MSIATAPPAAAPQHSAQGRVGRKPRLPVWALLGTAVLWGLVAGVWTPRGPVTSAQAESAIGISLAVGLMGGWLTRSRWAMILSPVAFAVAFELTRAGSSGPLVDGIDLGLSPFGILAFILGRGLHGALTLVPLVLGASIGAGLARRSEVSAQRRRTLGVLLRRTVAAGVTLALLILAVALARPASTAPILAANGEALAGSVAELSTLHVGGHDLGLMLRGNSTANPVLLFLAGGPGGSELGAMRRHGQLLERDFVVATVDQRGTGSSYAGLDPVGTLTLDNAVRDVIAVTNYLRVRYDKQKVILVGQSWGTILGVLAVQQRPDLFQAYVGVGQMVDPRATDEVFYTDTLAWARRTGDDKLVNKLVASGPPPYSHMLDYEAALTNDPEVYPYDHSGNSEGIGGFTSNLRVPEYSLLEQAHVVAAFLDVFTVLYPQLQGIDFRRDVPALEVPVFLAQGRHEAPGRSVPANQWFSQVVASSKEKVDFVSSGHRAIFEQPGAFSELMLHVATQTNGQ